MPNGEFSVIAVGAGPANLALAVALEEGDSPALAKDTLVLEQHPDVRWQRGLLLPAARSQVSFLKDLATLRNPRSRFSYLSFLHDRGRLEEFVNLGTFYPYRWEISEYLQWAAHRLEHVGIRYNSRVAKADARRAAGDPEGPVIGWTVTTADGAELRCRDLVIGTGRRPFVPDVFRRLPSDVVVHSEAYCSRIGELAARTAGRELRVVVVGGAQSAAEMFMAVHQDLPLSRPTILMRSLGLPNYQTSKFVNEIFFSSFVDDFYNAAPEVRRELLEESHQTNYGGLAPPFVDELYGMFYRQKGLGPQRSAVRILSEVVDARATADGIDLDVRDRRTGKVEPMQCDLVLLGTGYEQETPALVRGLAEQAGVQDVEISRQYRVDLGDNAWAALYLQGVNERTHGISDSLLSLLAHRSQEIADDLLARRAVAPARST
jgi:L-ornithine N5-oxygenase